jgi:hypothetical protein
MVFSAVSERIDEPESAPEYREFLLTIKKKLPNTANKTEPLRISGGAANGGTPIAETWADAGGP